MTQEDIAKFIEHVKQTAEGDVAKLRGDKDILPYAILLNPEGNAIIVGIATKMGGPEDKDALACFLATQAHKHKAVAGAIIWTVWLAVQRKDQPDLAPRNDPERQEAICIWEFNPVQPAGHVATLHRGGHRCRLDAWLKTGDESPTVGRFWDEIMPVIRINHAIFVN
jgi:hypothetical protein